MVQGANLATSAAKQFVVGRVRGVYVSKPEDAALTATLMAGPTGGRIHGWPVPDSVPYPAIVVQRYGSQDVTGPLGRAQPNVASTVRLQVKAICEGYDESPIEEAASILNQLLDGHAAVVDLTNPNGGSYGTFYVECNRESELLTDLPVEPDGTPFQHMGGIYNFFVSRTG